MWLDAPLDRSAHAPGPPPICPASGYRHLTLSHRRQRARQATTASNSQPASQPAPQGYRMHKHAEHIVKSSVLGIKCYARSDQIYTHQLGTKLHSRCRQCVWFTFFSSSAAVPGAAREWTLRVYCTFIQAHTAFTSSLVHDASDRLPCTGQRPMSARCIHFMCLTC